MDTPLLQAESAERRALLSQGLLDADAVAALVVEAIGDGRFLILTHGFVHQQLQRKVADPERWLRGMRQLHCQVG